MKKANLIIFLLLLSFLSNAQKETESSGHYRFIENRSQWPEQVKYSTDIEYGKLYVEDNSLLFDFMNPEDMDAYTSAHHSTSPNPFIPEVIRAHAYRLEFLNANPIAPKGKEELPGKHNYFKGNDPNKWGRDCSAFGLLEWQDLYNGVDLKLYSNDFMMKYDFIVHAGADPEQIRIAYQGVGKLSIKNGRLIIRTSVNEVIEQKPIAYQIIDGQKILVQANFHLEGNILSFVLGDFDPAHDLVIDPELIFSSYSGSFSNNFGYTATFDDLGFLYSGSSAFGNSYPVTTGAYEVNFQNGIVDMAITKWDTTGTFLIWSSYLGGSSDELPHSLIVNSARELFVYGTTSSLDFPTTPNAYDTGFNGGNGLNLLQGLGVNYVNGSDIVVSRFSSDGSDLMASTYVGGSDNDGLNSGTPLKYNYADEIRGEILIDDDNNIYVASSTNSSNFPTTPGAFQSTYAGGTQEGCIFKMDNNLSGMIWSSFLGGSSNDAVYALDLDSNDDVLVCGGTQSSDFPVSFGTLQQALGGGIDGFVTRLSSDGSSMINSTYWGSSAYDQVYFVELDSEDHVHVFGQTEVTGNFYIFNAAYNTPSSGQFITKFEDDLDELIWSTAFGTGNGAPNISPTAFLVDLCDKIYLSGWGSQVQGGPLTVTGMDVTPDAYQTTTTGNDFYLFVLESDASDIFYGSYYGGNQSNEHVDGGTSRFDRKGVMYQAVCAGCGGNDDFPIEPNPGAVSAVNNNSCNLGVFKFDFNIPVTVADFFAPNTLCVDSPIPFDNLSSVATEFIWDFGDDTGSDEFEPNHSYSEPGTYEVMLVASNPNSCNLADTVYQTVNVLNNSVSNLSSVEVCAGENIQIGISPSSDPDITYSWSPEEFLSDANAANPIFNGSEDSNYILQVSNGVCIDTLLQEVLVTNLDLQVPDDLVLCEEGELIDLNASSSSADTEFTWSLNSDYSDPLNDGPSDPDIQIEVDGPLTLYILAELENCSVEDEVLIEFTASQTQAVGDQVICLGDTIELYVLEPSEDLQYSWEPEALVISGQNTAQISTAPSVPTTYTVTSTNADGCQVSDEVNVVFSGLDGDALLTTAEPQTILVGGSSQLQVLPEGYEYLWTPAQTLDNPISSSPIATPEQSTTYHVVIEDGNCTYSDSVRVNVVDFICGPPLIYVPNAFTPNSDDRNETLYVRGVNLTRVNLKIYNRWGEKVFETNDQSEGWDGTYKGEPVDPAVFVYYLEADCGDGNTYFEKGNITVIR